MFVVKPGFRKNSTSWESILADSLVLKQLSPPVALSVIGIKSESAIAFIGTRILQPSGIPFPARVRRGETWDHSCKTRRHFCQWNKSSNRARQDCPPLHASSSILHRQPM
jgi:hypothetical protein